MTPSVMIRLAEGGPSLEVNVVYEWNRGDLRGPVMSAGSGPKDYIKNDVWALFAANPMVDRIIMVRAGGPPFLLMRRTDGYWFDMAGKQILRGTARTAGAAA